MHIAVCDDNMGDRRQIERLLKKESEKRAASTGILYTDSFGSCESLLANPMQYDAFYIDMCHTAGLTGVDVTNQLLAIGINAPIILCCSSINYREYPFPENVLFLEKPLKAIDICESLDHALEIKKNAEALIELREEKNTFYVREADIMYAVEENRSMLIHLKNGQILHIATDTANFFDQIEKFENFVAPTAKVIFNCRYVEKIHLSKVSMTDGTVFKVHRDCMPYVKQMVGKLK